MMFGPELHRGIGEDEVRLLFRPQSAMSCLTNRASGTRSRAASSIASDVSQSVTFDSEKRRMSSSALFPGPQPRS